MFKLRKADERGHFDLGWLDTYHTFSFSEYHDPAYMGFRSLRVLNDDVVQPGKGFGMHGHRDMEIVTYILNGAIKHEDTTGGGGLLRPGDVQRMSAGSGVQHSEVNGSDSEPVHLLQIWILPDKRGVTPRYDDRNFPLEERKNRLRLIASPDEAEGSLSLHQDARIYAAVLDEGKDVALDVAEGRGVWVQAAKGEVSVGYGFDSQSGEAKAGHWSRLQAGDGASLEGDRRLVIKAETGAEVLVFDLA